jgi:predicted ATP-grasp superfamily ATP-dependent carboligase
MIFHCISAFHGGSFRVASMSIDNRTCSLIIKVKTAFLNTVSEKSGLPVSIEIRELSEIKLRGGVLIDCTGTASMDRSNLGKRLISHLGLHIAAYVECDSFPTICTVIDSSPHPPMRIYSNPSSKISLVLSDFVPSSEVEKPLGRSILTWAKSKSMVMVVTTVIGQDNLMEGDLAAIGSTYNCKRRIEYSRIEPIEQLRLSGVPAVLLNEGSWTGFDVIALVVKQQSTKLVHTVRESIEDRIIQGIDVILPEMKLNFEESQTRSSSNQFTDEKSVSSQPDA